MIITVEHVHCNRTSPLLSEHVVNPQEAKEIFRAVVLGGIAVPPLLLLLLAHTRVAIPLIHEE